MKWHNIRNMIDHKTVRFLDFTPTSQCNARCMMCGIWKTPHHELSRAQADIVLEHYPHLDLMLVEGGEVALWRHLPYFVKNYLEQQKGEMLILSNGSTPVFWLKFVGKMSKLGGAFQRVRFVVSIDGPPNIHDTIRLFPGLYLNAVKSVNILKRHGNKVTLQYTPFKINEDCYEHVRDLGLSMGCDTIICYPSFHTRFQDALTLERADHDKLMAMYKDRTDRIDRWRRWKRLAFLDYAQSHAPMPCIGGRQFVAIDPEGHIKPCIMSDEVSGQVTDKGLMIYPETEDILSKIPQRCQYDASGNICSDYLPMTSLGMYPTTLWKWKIRKMLGRL